MSPIGSLIFVVFSGCGLFLIIAAALAVQADMAKEEGFGEGLIVLFIGCVIFIFGIFVFAKVILDAL